jgi:sugar-specific transcriptional regulator TrmB
MVTNILKEFGLTKSQIKVYVTLLQSHAAGASTLSRATGIKRLSIYSILNSLKEKGFITTFKKDNITYYSALEPEALLHISEAAIAHEKRKKNELDTFIKHIDENNMRAKSIYKRPSVQFYEGIEGMKKAYDDTLNATETIRAYACVDAFEKYLKEFFPEYYQRRAKKGISVRCITPKTPRAEEARKDDVRELRTTAFIPPEKYYFGPEINIYDDKVLIISFEESMGILIESEDMADAMKKVFELSWAEAQRLHAKRSTVKP